MKLYRVLPLVTLLAFPWIASSAEFEKAISDLVPKLAAPNVPDRYAAQMELQAMASNSSKPGNEAERAELSKVLAAKASDESVPQPARVWIVRQLEYMGAAEAVPALAGLMQGTDAELRECARRALEKNSSAEAAASLRAALAKSGEASWKIGLMNALGQRGDTEAAKLIIPALRDEQTATAAALALGRIASRDAIDALWSVFGKNPAASEALILAAKRLFARGDAANAGEIFKNVYDRGPMPARAAALSGLIQVNPAGASDLIGKVLSGNEPKLQQAAISAAVRSGDKGLAQMLAALLPRLAPSVKAQAITVLDSPVAEPQVIAAVQENDETVRRASLEALGRIGSAAGVPVLLQAATDDAKPGKSTAEAALVKISGEGAGAALEKAAAQGDARSRAVAINALAARKQMSALPALLNYAAEPDATVRKAALSALRQVGADNEFEPLAKLAIKANSPEAFTALEAVAARVKDKPAAARKLLALANPADEQALAALLDPLGALGGGESLVVVLKLASSSNTEIQDRAIQTLSNWPDFAAVPKLLDLASNPNAKLTRHNQALQGVVRLVKSAETEPVPARLEATLAAFGATRSDDEKKLVLSALATVPHPKAAETIKPLLGNAALKAEAGFAGIAIAEALVPTDPVGAKALAREIKSANISRELNRRADAVLSK